MSRHEDDNDDAISEIEGSSLFSQSDSDIIDSPADGYFTQRPHPQQYFTHNEPPSSSKTEEVERSPRQYEPAQYPSASQPPVWATESTPLLDAGPAPPDYYAATAARRNGREGPYGVSTYGSIEEEELRHERQTQRETPQVLLQAGLFSHDRPPQSMTQPGRGQDEENQTLLSTYKNPPRRWRGVCVRSRWTMRCANASIVVLIVLTIVLLSTMTAKHDSETSDPKLPEIPPTPTLPVGNPHLPHNPTQTSMPGCGYGTLSDSWHYDFKDLSSFSIEETISKQASDYDLGGLFAIRPAPTEQIPDVRVTINYVTGPGIKIVQPNPTLTKDSIKFNVPELLKIDTGYSYRPCIDAAISIDVKQGLQLENWTTISKMFSIYTRSHLFNTTDSDVPVLRMSGTTTLRTGSGNVEASYWSSRETIIETDSGTVHGRLALRDLLKVTTVSGSIILEAVPRPEDLHRPLPATLDLTTESGSIKTYVLSEAVSEDSITDGLQQQGDVSDSDFVPLRDYVTRVESRSGALTGSYLHGSHTSFKTKSGTIVAHILPVVLNVDNKTSLLTENLSGATSLTIKPPFGEDSLRNMQSLHDSSRGSGSIVLRYPDAWTGHILGRSTSGALIVRGKDIEMDWFSDLGYFGGKRISARKGNGNSLIDVRTSSGSVDLGIGANLRAGVL